MVDADDPVDLGLVETGFVLLSFRAAQIVNYGRGNCPAGCRVTDESIFGPVERIAQFDGALGNGIDEFGREPTRRIVGIDGIGECNAPEPQAHEMSTGVIGYYAVIGVGPAHSCRQALAPTGRSTTEINKVRSLPICLLGDCRHGVEGFSNVGVAVVHERLMISRERSTATRFRRVAGIATERHIALSQGCRCGGQPELDMPQGIGDCPVVTTAAVLDGLAVPFRGQIGLPKDGPRLGINGVDRSHHFAIGAVTVCLHPCGRVDNTSRCLELNRIHKQFKPCQGFTVLL